MRIIGTKKWKWMKILIIGKGVEVDASLSLMINGVKYTSILYVFTIELARFHSLTHTPFPEAHRHMRCLLISAYNFCGD